MDSSPGDPAEQPLLYLHEDWADDWAPSIRGFATRDALEANPRLAERPLADLARRLALPPLPPLSPEHRDVLQAVSLDPDRMVRVLGLAAQGTRLARIIDGPGVRSLASHCPVADIALAIRVSEGQGALAHGEVDLATLANGAHELGTRLLLAWAAALGAGMEGRLRLLLPKAVPAAGTEGARSHAPGEDRLVAAVASALLARPGAT